MWEFKGKQRPHFAIEPAPGQESVWDYPRPPALVAFESEVIVLCGNVEVAKTTSGMRVLETASPPTVYLPPGDVDLSLLKQSAGNSFCEWKGRATYWSLVCDGARIESVGWSYENPTEPFAAIKGFLSFYPASLDCFINGEKVRPQAGGFYGGWITDAIVGPYKGEPGTGGW